MIANGMELGPITSPSWLTATPLSLAGGSLAVTDGAVSLAVSTRDCRFWLPSSVGVLGTNFGCELTELDGRPAVGGVLSVLEPRFFFGFSFSSTGLNSDPMPPDLATRPQHEQRGYDGIDGDSDVASCSLSGLEASSLSLPFLLEDVSEALALGRRAFMLKGRTAGC